MSISQMRARSKELCNHWYAAAKSEELTNKPLGRIVLGEMLVLFRVFGQPVALLDRCLHRNALLSEGEVKNGCVACPYHGWTYNADGEVVHVPSEGGPPQAPYRSAPFPVREQDGLIWVWMGHERAPRDEQPFPMPYYSAPGWNRYYMTTRFSNSVTNLVENFMDVPHTVFVHKGWFRTRAQRLVRATVERTKDSVLVTYDQPSDAIGFSARVLNPKGLPMVHTDKFYMPNTTRVDYVFGQEDTAFVITSTCTPISEHETMVYTLISYKLGLFNHLARFFLPWYTRRVIQQDVEIMANQGRALQHYDTHRFNSTPADTLHLHIEALRDRAQAGEGPRPEPRIDEMEFWV